MSIRGMLVFISSFFLLVIAISWNPGQEGPSAIATADSPPERVLVKFLNGASAEDKSNAHKQNGGRLKHVISGIDVEVVEVAAGQGKEKAESYGNNPNVLYAEVDGLAQAIGSVDDTYFGSQWGLSKVQASQAWDITTGSPTGAIAVLDTGIDVNHKDLSRKVTSSVNFTDSPSAGDVYGHGTHVAGTAAADTNNGLGVAGLDYNSTIFNVKVLADDNWGYYSWISQGIVWSADNGAQVVNLSLGGTSPSSTLESAVNYAWSQGVVVAAAGNNGSTVPWYPAYYTNVIAVAATDSNDRLASFSHRGDWVDAAAPGAGVLSTTMNNGYGSWSGTSMATPPCRWTGGPGLYPSNRQQRQRPAQRRGAGADSGYLRRHSGQRRRLRAHQRL